MRWTRWGWASITESGTSLAVDRSRATNELKLIGRLRSPQSVYSLMP